MSHQVPTLYDVALYILDSVGELYYGTATGGSTTTIVDSELEGDEQDWKNGTAFVVDSTDDLAPKGEMSKIATYDHGDGTVTLDDTLTAVVAAGDKYGIADSRFSIEQIVGAVNRALVKMGDIYQMDTSLTSSGSLTRYTLPAGINERNLMKVFYRNSGVADREEPMEITGIRVTPDGELILPVALPTGKLIELHWNGPHARLESDSDLLDTAVHLERMVAEATLILIDRRLRQTDGEDRQLMRDWNAARDDVVTARVRHRIRKAQPSSGGLMQSWGFRGTRRRNRSNKYGPYLV